MAEIAIEPGVPVLPALHQTRKAVLASAIGNVLEWYDFGVLCLLRRGEREELLPRCQSNSGTAFFIRRIRRRPPDARAVQRSSLRWYCDD
jgi:hypothetical protein